MSIKDRKIGRCLSIIHKGLCKNHEQATAQQVCANYAIGESVESKLSLFQLGQIHKLCWTTCTSTQLVQVGTDQGKLVLNTCAVKWRYSRKTSQTLISSQTLSQRKNLNKWKVKGWYYKPEKHSNRHKQPTTFTNGVVSTLRACRNFLDCSRPPLILNDTIPPNPLHCLLASSCWGWEGRPGYMASVTRGEASRNVATAMAFLWCSLMRRWSVFKPLLAR